jgi:hypothetical protein
MTTIEAPQGDTAPATAEVATVHPSPQGLNSGEFFLRWIRGGLPTPECVSDHAKDIPRHHSDAYNDRTDLGDTETAIPVAPWYVAYARRHTAPGRQQ